MLFYVRKGVLIVKAIRYHGPKRPLIMEEIPRPEPGPGEVLIRVCAAGLCHTELHESVRLVSDGKIRTVVDHVLKLDRYQEAIDDLSAGKPVGRIVLTP